jgi:hypothetical protein
VLELSRADPDTLKGAELGVNELHRCPSAPSLLTFPCSRKAYRTLEEMLSTSLQHASRTGIAKAILKASADKEEMRRLRNQLDETFKRFMVRSMSRVQSLLIFLTCSNQAASHLRIEIALKELIAAFDRGERSVSTFRKLTHSITCRHAREEAQSRSSGALRCP